MGFFSWFTSDTKRSISNEFSSRGTFSVYMITEDGQVFKEEAYMGYGTFGGKPVYELIAEMNNLPDDEAAIHMVYLTKITNGERTYEAYGTDFFNWEAPLAQEGGRKPNELVSSGDFKKVFPNGYGDWNIAVANGYKMPKFVEEEPPKENFKEYWDSLPYPDSCPDQGYFYTEDDNN